MTKDSEVRGHLGRPLRKACLTVHVLLSVGWFGAVLVYLALGVLVMTSDDREGVRAAYVTMDAAAPVVLVPLALGAVLTGVAQSLLTPWGLLRHYWVVFKLGLSLAATVVLLAYLGTLAAFADRAMVEPPVELGRLNDPSVMVHSVLAVVVLTLVTVLAVYKPRGLTPRGARSRMITSAPAKGC